MSTAFHPQTDGQTERQDQELEAFLRMFCNCEQNDWASLLNDAAFAHNSRVHSSTKMTPLEAALGKQSTFPDGIRDEPQLKGEAATTGITNAVLATARVAKMRQDREKIEANL